MKTLNQLVAGVLPEINEVFPWDVDEKIKSDNPPLLLDIREPDEFDAMHIAGSMHVPRGILETACEYNYDETVRELVEARNREVVVICRSGIRSALAVFTMQLMGYENVSSMKTGLRGWNDYELPLVDKEENRVDIDDADEFFTTRLRPDQVRPKQD